MTQESILEEAARIVNGGRQEDYGKPEDNFSNIAKAWNAYLNALGKPLVGRDVGLMMAILKCIRDANREKRDNLVDGAGYFECASRCAPRNKAPVGLSHARPFDDKVIVEPV